MNLTATAKTYGIGRNHFIEFLRQTGFIFKSDTNKPIQKYLNMGLFEVKPVPYGNGNLTTQTLITGAGQTFFQKVVDKHRRMGTYPHLLGASNDN